MSEGLLRDLRGAHRERVARFANSVPYQAAYVTLVVIDVMDLMRKTELASQLAQREPEQHQLGHHDQWELWSSRT